MPNLQDDPLATFLQYYGEYFDAKEANHALKIWLLAVRCRSQLQKMGEPSKEAETCENIFKAFVTHEQAVQIYHDLYEDSRSYPGSREARPPRPMPFGDR